MSITNPGKKQKRSLGARHEAYLRTGPYPERLSSNIYDLLDDDNAVDKRLIKKTRRYMIIHYKHTA